MCVWSVSPIIGEPPAGYASHRRAVWSHTFFREHDHVSGRLAPGDIALPWSDERTALEAKADEFFNGDTMSWTPHCYDRLSGRPIEYYKDGFFGVCVELRVAQASDKGAPSKNRWQSMTEGAAKIVGGNMTFNLPSQALEEAFPNWNSLLPQEGDDEFRAYNRGKTYRTRKVLADARKSAFQAVVTWCAPPLDRLFLRLEHLDASGSLLRDVACSRTSPLDDFMREMRLSLETPLLEGELSTLARHYGGDCGNDDLLRELFDMKQSMSAQFWWRRLPLKTWPIRLLVELFEGGEHAFESLFSACLCCLDPHMGRKLRRLYTCAQDMRGSKEVLAVLRTWARQGTILNMSLERLLALIKSGAALPKQRAPDVMRVGATGFLTQWLKLHKQCGGKQLAEATREQFVAEGVPIRAGKRKRDASQAGATRVRPHVEAANLEVKVQKREKLARGEDWTEEDRAAAWEVAMQKWRQKGIAGKREDVVRARARKDAMQEKMEGSGPSDSVSISMRDNARCLWGVQNEGAEMPLADMEDAIRRKLRMAPGERLGGFTSYSSDMNEHLRAQMVVHDEGAIPAAAKFKYDQPCGVAHPGCCRHADRDAWPTLSSASLELTRYILQAGPGRSYVVQVRGEYDHNNAQEDFYHVAYRRGARPRLVVLAPMARIGGSDNVYQLCAESDEQKFTMAMGAIKELIAPPRMLRSLQLRLRDFTPTPKTLWRIQLHAPTSEFDKVWPGSPAVRSVRAPAGKFANAFARLAGDKGLACAASGSDTNPSEEGGGEEDSDSDLDNDTDSGVDLPPAPVPAPAPVPEPIPAPEPTLVDAHKYWALSRSRAAATCGGCKGVIAAWDMRAVFTPNRKLMSMADRRIWSNLFPRRYHLQGGCLQTESVQPTDENIVIDVKRLPKGRAETDADFKQAVQDGRGLLCGVRPG